ncbi:hypothetical protein IMCC3088_2808 [Aequoribacter fuscus]|uniref:Uncharacterized protein n=1 Tax=Aequoribacter fuscus TaxID=2518989 RepID=F3L529_9GAMM|nr:hypothetical protein IMCC3088_2808 [Aequoribacter fuscus]
MWRWRNRCYIRYNAPRHLLVVRGAFGFKPPKSRGHDND